MRLECKAGGPDCCLRNEILMHFFLTFRAQPIVCGNFIFFASYLVKKKRIEFWCVVHFSFICLSTIWNWNPRCAACWLKKVFSSFSHEQMSLWWKCELWMHVCSFIRFKFTLSITVSLIKICWNEYPPHRNQAIRLFGGRTVFEN